VRNKNIAQRKGEKEFSPGQPLTLYFLNNCFDVIFDNSIF
jgi:hypothetical protein